MLGSHLDPWSPCFHSCKSTSHRSSAQNPPEFLSHPIKSYNRQEISCLGPWLLLCLPLVTLPAHGVPSTQHLPLSWNVHGVFPTQDFVLLLPNILPLPLDSYHSSGFLYKCHLISGVVLDHENTLFPLLPSLLQLPWSHCAFLCGCCPHLVCYYCWLACCLFLPKKTAALRGQGPGWIHCYLPRASNGTCTEQAQNQPWVTKYGQVSPFILLKANYQENWYETPDTMYVLDKAIPMQWENVCSSSSHGKHLRISFFPMWFNIMEVNFWFSIYTLNKAKETKLQKAPNQGIWKGLAFWPGRTAPPFSGPFLEVPS